MKTMYRTIFNPTETDSVIPFRIPDEWYGRDIEVIVFPLDTARTHLREPVKDAAKNGVRKFKAIPSQYLFDTKTVKFTRDEANDYE
jgi:hypothetical protein